MKSENALIPNKNPLFCSMKFYSTQHKAPLATLKEAVLNGLPNDNGLYMPERITPLSVEFLNNFQQYSFRQIAYQVAHTLLQNSIDADLLKSITDEAVNFEAPVNMLSNNIGALELFYGPSLAFKDFGARFMARLMSNFVKDEKRPLHILVATSGDTGGAVALGFYNVPNIQVTILYPKGKVSNLQELQLTTLGKNITALEVDGVFDDCQALVKQAFLDVELRKQLLISSANSINISRLVPQMFYYFEAVKQVMDSKRPIAMSIPSGNFGNITAGLIAQKMGLPIHKFIAAVNNNDGFFHYLKDGVFTAKTSKETLSTAMDVGNPSNLARINDIFESDVEQIKKSITSYTYNNKQTEEALKEIHQKYNYISDPHGAVGYLGIQAYIKENPEALGIFQVTAHPAKFKPTVEPILNTKVEIPKNLAVLIGKKKQAIAMDINYTSFKKYLNTLI